MKHSVIALLALLFFMGASGQKTSHSFFFGKWRGVDTLSGKLEMLEFVDSACARMHFNERIQEITYQLQPWDSVHIMTIMTPRAITEMVLIPEGPDTITFSFLEDYKQLLKAKNLPPGTVSGRWGAQSGVRLTRQRK
jgi:hypothetical protein